MRKTRDEIEADFYQMIKESAIGKGLTGAVYRDGMRPDDAKQEDCVVKLLSMENGQIQHGILIANIYFLESYNSSGKKVIPIGRRREIAGYVRDFFQNFANTEYWIEMDDEPECNYVEGIEQYFLNIRIDFRRFSH